VIALDIGGPFSHFLDCFNREGNHTVDSISLEWRMNGMETRLESSVSVVSFANNTRAYTRRLNLTPLSGTPVIAEDVGTYMCLDTESGDTMSILLVEGVRTHVCACMCIMCGCMVSSSPFLSLTLPLCLILHVWIQQR
jgi:hypothetical protein